MPVEPFHARSVSAQEWNKGGLTCVQFLAPGVQRPCRNMDLGMFTVDGISSSACLVQCLLPFQGLGFSARHKWKKWPLPLGEGAKISPGLFTGISCLSKQQDDLILVSDTCS